MAVTVAVKDLERVGRGLFQDIFPAFAWTDCQNTLSASNPAEIRTGHLSNTYLKALLLQQRQTKR